MKVCSGQNFAFIWFHKNMVFWLSHRHNGSIFKQWIQACLKHTGKSMTSILSLHSWVSTRPVLPWPVCGHDFNSLTEMHTWQRPRGVSSDLTRILNSTSPLLSHVCVHGRARVCDVSGVCPRRESFPLNSWFERWFVTSRWFITFQSADAFVCVSVGAHVWGVWCR